MKLSIVIVTFNSFNLVKKCIQSIYEQRLKSFEIILVDNASEEPGLKEILNRYPDLILIKNKKNLGL